MRVITILPAALLLLATATPSLADKAESRAAASSVQSETSGGALTLEAIAALPAEVAPLEVTFKVQNPKPLTAKQRFAIPAYSIGFFRTGEVRATAGGFGSASVQRSSKIETYLSGIDDAALTALADEAYLDLVERLKTAGIEVVPAEQLMATPEFGGLKRQDKITGGKGKIDGRAEKGWTTHGAAPVGVSSGLGFSPTPLSGFAQIGVFSTMNKLSKAVDAALIVPRLGIDYADMESSGSKIWGGSASVSAETRFAINALSKASVSYGIGPAGDSCELLLKDAVGSPEPFAVLQHTADNSDSAALSTAFALMGLSNMYAQRNTYAVQVAPERYKALVRAAYAGFNQAIVDEIRKARGLS